MSTESRGTISVTTQFVYLHAEGDLRETGVVREEAIDVFISADHYDHESVSTVIYLRSGVVLGVEETVGELTESLS